MSTADKAVILAAGRGTRLEPFTDQTPKPLLKVRGVRIIDSIIQALKANGIHEIYVVTGYKKECFEEWAENRPEVTLIENPDYENCNNISSLYAARKHIDNTVILDGDQYIHNPGVLKNDFERSGYCCAWTDGETAEWLVTEENGRIVSCSRDGGAGGWRLFSISFWNHEDGLRLMEQVELEYKEKRNTQDYWDDIPLFLHREDYCLGIRRVQAEDIEEIDSCEELLSADPSYEKELRAARKKDGSLDRSNLNWGLVLIPLILIAGLCLVFLCMPEESKFCLEKARYFIDNRLGSYYILLGAGILLFTLYLSFSGYGNIRFGTGKPQYSSLKWGSMIFTSTMAADILFYSLCEWSLYAGEPYIEELGGMQKWSPTYPLFHWGPIAWGIYVALAAAFGFMLHIRGRRRQCFSEACRPILGEKTDRAAGKLIDLTAVFALLAGTATTFSVATPLLTAAVCEVTGLENTKGLTVMVLILIASIYTVTVLSGIKGIAKLASICVGLFAALLLYVFIGGGEAVYIVETGISSVGNMLQNFIGMATWLDPLRENSFPQNWTIFYWAYWLVWCVATPFFIGMISRGRTVRSTVLGAYGWGLAGTYTSFIILGNYGLSQQMKGQIDTVSYLAGGGTVPEAVIRIFRTLPLPAVGLILLVLTMICFYSTTFDTLTMVISYYTYKKIAPGQEPDKRIRVFWAVLFILLPIGLIFSESSMENLQSVSIIAAFPIGIVVLLVLASFLKDAKRYLRDSQASR